MTNELLTPGTYYLTVTNRQGGSTVNYRILASELLSNDLVRLTNGTPYTGLDDAVTNSSLNAGIDYYVFTVSSNAFQAAFELYNLSGNVNLYARKGSPITNCSKIR